MKKAIVLLSGGLDSTTALYVAKSQGFDELYAITFKYAGRLRPRNRAPALHGGFLPVFLC